VGSAAAPTAGLHFTDKLLDELRANGVETAHVTLHVGLGTFAPVREDDLSKHKMHSEFGMVSPETADAINRAKEEGRRVIAVGTTTVRTLESFAQDGRLEAGSKWTDIFIAPGFEYQIVDGLITNFHLPESTLLMLVSAFVGNNYKDNDRGRQVLLEAYAHAIEKRYRFYSFGDAMLIV
jgi:S-adenosylmethionine:tRNA ribosyltransferase-isomerase